MLLACIYLKTFAFGYVLTYHHNQKETPYSSEGRSLNFERTKRKPLKVRADELLNLEYSELIGNLIYD
jgi:hypothetical protein